MNITSAGIGSGLELESIIEAFVTAESVPTEIRLQQKQERVETELSGLGTFKSALSSFKSTAEKLSSVDDFREQTVSVSNDDISVTTNGYATDGSFSINVMQLAKATRIQTPDFADSTTTVGTGTLTFSAGSDTFNVAIDAADDLVAIRNKINSASENFGVTVSLVNTDSGSYLSYSSSSTGTANALTVTTTDAALDNLATNATVTQTAQDAIIEIDGNGNFVTSSTNEFKNTIQDVTIVAKKETTGDPAQLDITQDDQVAKDLINEFVNSFNSLADTMAGLGSPKFGKLPFDSDLRAMKGQLNSILSSVVSGMTGDIQSLADIGVTFNKTGNLEISPVGIGTMDSGVEALDKAIDNNLDEIGELFAGDNGIVNQLTTLIDSYNDSDGTLTQRQDSLNETLSGISDEYDDLESRLRSYEDTLRKRFANLDSTIASYNATADWLKSALQPVKSSSS